VVINQAMKQQPMTVYRIRNALTGYRKSLRRTLNLSNSLLASHSPASAATDRRAVHSLTDEVELPVEEFMGTTFRPKSILRFQSVPADIHYTLEGQPAKKAQCHGDESILRDVPDNITDKWVGTKVAATPNGTASSESHEDEEENKPDQLELGMSVPVLTLASMRNGSNKIDTQHSFSCENIVK
jgi:hypothetical protein